MGLLDSPGGKTVSNDLSKDATWIASALGRRLPDAAGAPVGAARLDVDKAYAGVPEWLQQVINASSREAWEAIRAKIDYIYEGLDYALAPVQEETGFDKPLKERLQQGQKLFFKPNIVMALGIDFQTHGAGYGSGICTEWPLIAALMRWFHDRHGVRYHQMALGEGSSSISAVAGMFSMMNSAGQKVTPEAVIEGRCGDFYGGWGFYFARKYLAECPGTDPRDDPMQGFEASVAGSYAPPGETRGLMVYDLNLIDDEPRKGRQIDVPGGINFKHITLHKAVIGGDPADAADRKAYPGCVLVNVPKLKVHNVTLFTNAIKNLGVGLYPMQYSRNSDGSWAYGNPHHRIPGLKDGIPHDVWYPDIDRKTGLPDVADGDRKPGSLCPEPDVGEGKLAQFPFGPVDFHGHGDLRPGIPLSGELSRILRRRRILRRFHADGRHAFPGRRQADERRKPDAVCRISAKG